VFLHIAEVPVRRKAHHYPENKKEKSYDLIPEDSDGLHNSRYYVFQEMLAG
jgi:hypothetical protein